MSKHQPTTLIILDGWGLAPASEDNAVTTARTPFLDSIHAAYPRTELHCFGEAVGLPEGQMGNSEVGHLNLGAGRVVYQDITRINLAIKNGDFFKNSVFNAAMDKVRQSGGTLHLMGLIGPGGVHSLSSHLYALIKMSSKRKLPKVAIHAFLDGRDTNPDTGAGYMRELMDFLADHPQARVVSLSGRYWAMDRDKRWDRVEKAYNAVVRGQGPETSDPVQAVKDSYAREEFDEFVRPTVVVDQEGKCLSGMRSGDAAIFFNFRADRAREMTWAINQKDFSGFDVSDRPELVSYVCMTNYDETMGLTVAFPHHEIQNTLSEVISLAGLKQLHIAETEKYAHVTFFFNGGGEQPVEGEDRILVPSPKEVATYDQKPSMSAPQVTDQVLERIGRDEYDFIVMNYANGDMVGHTGVMAAAVEAMETLDACLARVIPAVLEAGGRVFLTADHGNAEQMKDPVTGGPYTAHTVSNLVPFYHIAPDAAQRGLRSGGKLADVAPTVLDAMGLDQPEEMTGRSLLA
jgi:2,3-bisphosphoglycerate-independent phosphoglycerate mutase